MVMKYFEYALYIALVILLIVLVIALYHDLSVDKYRNNYCWDRDYTSHVEYRNMAWCIRVIDGELYGERITDEDN